MTTKIASKNTWTNGPGVVRPAIRPASVIVAAVNSIGRPALRNHVCSPPMRSAASTACAAVKAAAPITIGVADGLRITRIPCIAAVAEAAERDQIADVAAPVRPDHPPRLPIAPVRDEAHIVAVAAGLVPGAVQPDERPIASRRIRLERGHEEIGDPRDD